MFMDIFYQQFMKLFPLIEQTRFIASPFSMPFLASPYSMPFLASPFSMPSLAFNSRRDESHLYEWNDI
jgi:hypothetical protein